MIQKTHITVAEAATLVKKSKALIYRVIDQGKLRAEDTSDGLRLRTTDVLRVFADRKPGRPRRNTPPT